ncbi:hypothetical protein E4U43_005932, partial [Claviceps pusilla]
KPPPLPSSATPSANPPAETAPAHTISMAQLAAPSTREGQVPATTSHTTPLPAKRATVPASQGIPGWSLDRRFLRRACPAVGDFWVPSGKVRTPTLETGREGRASGGVR